MPQLSVDDLVGELFQKLFPDHGELEIMRCFLPALCTTFRCDMDVDRAIQDKTHRTTLAVDWPRSLDEVFEASDDLLYLASLCSTLYHIDMPTRVQGAVTLWRKTYHVRNAQLFSTIHGVLKALNTADLPVMVLKGVALRQLIHPHHPRKMYDVDLYVQPHNFDEAQNVIVKQGFSPTLESMHSIDFQKGPHVGLDLHWAPFKELISFQLDDAFFDEVSEVVEFQDRLFYLPKAEMLLTVVMTDFFSDLLSYVDFNRKVRWITDMLLLLFRPHFNFEKFFDLVERFDLKAQFVIAHKMIQRTFPAWSAPPLWLQFAQVAQEEPAVRKRIAIMASMYQAGKDIASFTQKSSTHVRLAAYARYNVNRIKYYYRTKTVFSLAKALKKDLFQRWGVTTTKGLFAFGCKKASKKIFLPRPS